MKIWKNPTDKTFKMKISNFCQEDLSIFWLYKELIFFPSTSNFFRISGFCHFLMPYVHINCFTCKIRLPNESQEVLVPKNFFKDFIGAYYAGLLYPYLQIFKNARLKRRFSMEFRPTAEVAQNTIWHLKMILTDSQHHIFDTKIPIFAC